MRLSARDAALEDPRTPPLPAACFDDLPPPLQDAVFQAAVGEAFPLRAWGAGGAGARSSLRGVCRAWAARLAALVTTAHVSSFWLPAAADAVSQRPGRFPGLVELHAFVALLPAPHVRAALRALCTPQRAWARLDVHLVLADGGDDSFATTMLSDATLCAVAAACPRLRALRVRRSPGGRPRRGVVAPALRAPTLRVLDLDGCARLTDAAVAAVARGCPGLRAVALAGCAALERPALRGALLAQVDLSFCSSLTDDSVATLLAGSPALKHLSLAMHPCALGTGTQLRAPRLNSHSLQHLSLAGLPEAGCAALADAPAWLAVLAGCPELRTLRGWPEPLLPALPPPWAPVVDVHGAYAGLVRRDV